MGNLDLQTRSGYAFNRSSPTYAQGTCQMAKRDWRRKRDNDRDKKELDKLRAENPEMSEAEIWNLLLCKIGLGALSIDLRQPRSLS